MRTRKIISWFLIICLVVSSQILPAAALTEPSAARVVEEISSSDNYHGEVFTAKTPADQDNLLYVSGKTNIPTTMFRIQLIQCTTDKTASAKKVLDVFVRPTATGEFSICINTKEGNIDLPGIVDEKGSVVSAGENDQTQPGNKAVPAMEEGLYRLWITRAVTEEEADMTSEWWNGPLGGGRYGFVCKDIALQVSGEDNNPKLICYDGNTEQMNSIRNRYEASSDTIESFTGAAERYLSADLSDIPYVLADPDNPDAKVERLTDTQAAYLKKVSTEITAGATSQYEKLEKIYAYISKNFYYDYYALETGKNQYYNPYDNLYAMRNDLSNNHSHEGKVATVCDGHAAMVVALARAEGIPSRIVSGAHIDSSKLTWETVNLSKSTHWWAEAYVKDDSGAGRWMVIDPKVGSLNGWYRDSADDAGEWVTGNCITYAGFDPSDEAFSGAYLLLDIKPGASESKYLCYKNEVETLRTFLNTAKGDTSNGKKLNTAYDAHKIETWGTGVAGTFSSDGFGRAKQIKWNGKDLYGKAVFDGFTALRYLEIYNNDLSELSLAGCTDLRSVTASYNNFTKFDSSDSKNLSAINAKENPLTCARFYVGDELTSFICEQGTFAFSYNKDSSTPVKLYVGEAPEGMKFEGLFDSQNRKISSDKEISFLPTDTSYKLVFIDNSAERIDAPKVVSSNSKWDGTIKLSWDSIAGADQYEIYHSTSLDGEYSRYDKTSETSYTMGKKALGASFYYKIKAVCTSDDTKSSVFSIPVKGTQILGAPQGISASLSAAGKPVIRWNKVDGAEKYQLWASTTGTDDYILKGTTTGTSITHNSAENGVLYYYKVKAAGSSQAVTSDFSGSYSIRCVNQNAYAKPLMEVTSNEATGKPIISWNKVTGASRYQLWMSTGGDYKNIGETSGTSITHNSATAGSLYYYKVKAVGSNGTSPYSDRKYIRCKYAKPVIKVIAKESTGKPVISWSKVAGAAKYELWMSTGGSYSCIGTTSGTSITHNSAKSGSLYYYKVRAAGSNSSASSAYSDRKYIRCKYAKPIIKVTTNSGGKPVISWSKVTGAAKYELWMSTGGDYKNIGTTSGTSITHNSAKRGTLYYYKVRAVGSQSGAASAYSDRLYIRCK